MMLMTSELRKGNELEAAVRAIEETILRYSPGFAENSFSIESKKIIASEGVRHEIDLWVSINIRPGYEATFIFECKNWEDKVGKNEIIVFSAKIGVANAQKGFFIAKSFTKDAVAQARKDARIQLLLVSEFPTDRVPVPFDFHFVILEGMHTELTLDARVKNNPERISRVNVNVKDVIVLDGHSVSLEVIGSMWAKQICEKRSNSFRSERAGEGIYALIAEGTMDFESGRLFADGREIATVRYKCEFNVRVVRPAVVSHFNVESRGRSIQLAPVSIDQNSLQVRLTFPERHG